MQSRAYHIHRARSCSIIIHIVHIGMRSVLLTHLVSGSLTCCFFTAVSFICIIFPCHRVQVGCGKHRGIIILFFFWHGNPAVFIKLKDKFLVSVNVIKFLVPNTTMCLKPETSLLYLILISFLTLYYPFPCHRIKMWSTLSSFSLFFFLYLYSILGYAVTQLVEALH